MLYLLHSVKLVSFLDAFIYFLFLKIIVVWLIPWNADGAVQLFHRCYAGLLSVVLQGM